MKNKHLRLSNYNYDAATFLERVQDLFARDNALLGDAVIRAVLQDVPGAGKQQVLTRIDVLPKEALPGPPEVLDYGPIVFVCARSCSS